MTAFQATYSDFKLIRTRKVVQIVLEVPVEQSNTVLEVLGGMPNPAAERWVGVAVLKRPQAEKESEEKSPDRTPATPRPVEDKQSAGAKREKMDWREVQPAAQAGIRCGEASFVAFLRDNYGEDFSAMENDAAATVRFLCGVNSRAELGTKHAARVIWHQLDSQYQAWKVVEHA